MTSKPASVAPPGDTSKYFTGVESIPEVS
jgi:hypothetical protein